MKQDRYPFKFFGRTIGTITGWDGDLGEMIWLYDFEPISPFPGPKCDTLGVNESDGTFAAVKETEGKEDIKLWSADIITTLHAIPRDAT